MKCPRRHHLGTRVASGRYGIYTGNHKSKVKGIKTVRAGVSHGCENTHKYFVILKIEKVDMSAGKSKKLFFSPKCKLFLPFVSIFSFTLSSAEQMQTAGWPGWDVSHKEQRLIADSADKINFGPGKKND